MTGNDRQEPATRDTLADLLVRVEGAEGADREIDCDLGVALGLFMLNVDDRLGIGRGKSWVRLDEDGGATAPGQAGDMLVPAYTASLDQSLALCERVLSGWMRFVGDLDPSDMRACATITHERPPTPPFRGFAPQGQYALAVIAAVLRALIAQAETDTPEPPRSWCQGDLVVRGSLVRGGGEGLGPAQSQPCGEASAGAEVFAGLGAELSVATDSGQPGPFSKLVEAEWQDLLDKDDRTSPEEYPDMVLINRAELAGAMMEAWFGRVPEPHYTPEQQRVAEYIVNLTGIGGGDDPVGFLMASHAALGALCEERAANTKAWRGALDSVEAYVQDRTENDEGKGGGEWSEGVRYLGEKTLHIIALEKAHVGKDAEMILNADRTRRGREAARPADPISRSGKPHP